MGRFHSILDVRTGQETEVPFSAEEEAAADAAEAATNRPRVPKALVRDRLTEAQRIQALSLMTAEQRARWYNPDYPTVFCDDADLSAVVNAIGLDPNAVLAP